MEERERRRCKLKSGFSIRNCVFSFFYKTILTFLQFICFLFLFFFLSSHDSFLLLSLSLPSLFPIFFHVLPSLLCVYTCFLIRFFLNFLNVFSIFLPFHCCFFLFSLMSCNHKKHYEFENPE